MRNDLVPRFSTAAVEAMQQELLEIDYKGLMHDDLMEHEVRCLSCHTATNFIWHRLEIGPEAIPARAASEQVGHQLSTELCQLADLLLIVISKACLLVRQFSSLAYLF
jgi:hypothetical protein